MKSIALNNGITIPAIGLGTWQSTEDAVYKAVQHALNIGYRHIDTAAIYGNENEVGQAIADSSLNREEIFLTTKMWNDVATYDGAIAAFEESLKKLKTDYVDLYLIHWPGSYERNLAVWRAFEDLYEQGKIKAIGVSNFSIHHLEHLLKDAKVKPVVNQVECHIFYQNTRLQDFCHAHDIYLQAYAPLTSKNVQELVKDEKIEAIAKKYGVNNTKVALRWLVQRDIIALPKSVNMDRIEQNFNIDDFELSKEDMIALRKLNNGVRTFPEPDNADFGFPMTYKGELID